MLTKAYLRSLGHGYSGQIGHQFVGFRWRDHQRWRTYVVPTDPNTSAQQTVRQQMIDKAIDWNNLTDAQRKAYKDRANKSHRPLTGYNLFLKEEMVF